MFEPYLYLIASILLLFYGAELLVRGGCQIALKFNISTAIIGLTIVALGTSTPEIFSSISAQMKSIDGEGDIAIGNVIGSNICNIGLVLGLSAAICGASILRDFLKREIPILLGTVVLLFLFAISDDYKIVFYEGLVLFTLFIVYTIMQIKIARSQRIESDDVDTSLNDSTTASVLRIIVGIILLGIGGHYIVDSSIEVAQLLGMPEKAVGLFIVAFGTSCPELATSVIASLKKESDILIGNIVGSNIMNVLIVIGVTPMIKKIQIDDTSILYVDYIFMAVFSVLLFGLALHKSYFHKWKGFVILSFYLVYVVYLFQKS